MTVLLSYPGMTNRLQAIGLPKHLALPFTREVLKWQTNSGPAWTVARLKSIKNDLVRESAGLPPLTWVRKNRSGGWYGVWGALRRYATISERTFARAVSSLMAYSFLKPDSPTEEHLDKLYASVQAQDLPLDPHLVTKIRESARTLLGNLDLAESIPLITYQGHPSTRSPVFQGASVPQNDFLEKELDWCREPYNRLFLNRHWGCYKHVLVGLDSLKVDGPLQGLSGGAMERTFGPYQNIHSIPGFRPPFMKRCIGNVVPLTKDGGWKVRWIANPGRIHQLALYPLTGALFDALKKLPWDCTYEQERGHTLIQEHLAAGKTAHAVDLSSATDYFPLSLQLEVLRELFGDDQYIDLFAELSRCEWQLPKHVQAMPRGKNSISWTKGQPMGLHPSFASFALTHGLLLHALGGQEGDFFVLGDDVVILRDDLHRTYLSTLESLGCPHDPVKSITSDRLTEFAGKILTPTSVLPQYKWRAPNDDSFMVFMQTFGQRFEKLLSKEQRSIYRQVGRLLPPYGCNHTFGEDAPPLDQVLQQTWSFEDSLPEKKPRRLFTSFLRWISSTLRPERPESLYHALLFDEVREMARTFDEKVARGFSASVLPAREFWQEELTDIFEVTGISPGLPSVTLRSKGGRTSLLEWYQTVLKGLA